MDVKFFFIILPDWAAVLFQKPSLCRLSSGQFQRHCQFQQLLAMSIRYNHNECWKHRIISVHISRMPCWSRADCFDVLRQQPVNVVPFRQCDTRECSQLRTIDLSNDFFFMSHANKVGIQA
jgi:hypothetical protein